MKKVLAKYNGRTKNRASTLPITNEESLTKEAALKLSLKGYILYKSHIYMNLGECFIWQLLSLRELHLAIPTRLSYPETELGALFCTVTCLCHSYAYYTILSLSINLTCPNLPLDSKIYKDNNQILTIIFLVSSTKPVLNT